jgi:hypothetical protein
VNPADLARCEQKIERQADGCWAWTGALTQRRPRGGWGYAIADIGGKTTQVHRAMYEHHRGPIPDGLTLDHLCRVRRCVNPAHLEPVTGQENTLRGVGPTAENAVKTHCPKGHSYEGLNLYIDKSGRRHCRECRRARSRNWWASNGTDYARARRARQKAGA